MSKIKTDACEHCGGENIIDDCMWCGAPQCCQDCCDKAMRHQLIADNAGFGRLLRATKGDDRNNPSGE